MHTTHAFRQIILRLKPAPYRDTGFAGMPIWKHSVLVQRSISILLASALALYRMEEEKLMIEVVKIGPRGDIYK